MIYQIPRKARRLGDRTDSLSDQVYMLLHDAIVSGRLRPGERILEKKLAHDLKMSRTPVREALLRLQAEGTVICKSRSSYKVRAISVGDVREIYETLGILESAAVGQVGSRITSADIALLKRYNRKMAAAVVRGDFQRFGFWNRNFHDVFLFKLANHTLREVCDAMRARLFTFPVRHHALRGYLQKSVREHREIIRLARGKDSRGLRQYFQRIHWSYEKDRPYIEAAFDQKGQAAIIF